MLCITYIERESTLSFAVVVRDVLAPLLDDKDLTEMSDAVSEEVYGYLKDEAVRRETYDIVYEHLDEISMLEIHSVLDALVLVLKGGPNG